MYLTTEASFFLGSGPVETLEDEVSKFGSRATKLWTLSTMIIEHPSF
jgi:hypothetical protein